MLSPDTVDPAIAWLQGFLRAFEWFNHKTNYVCTLTLDILPKPMSVQQAIESHFGGDLESLALTPVEDWQDFVRELLGRWLFQFSDRSMDHLEDPKGAFSLSHDSYRGMMLDDVMRRLTGVISPSAVWKVEVETRGWYECHYEDLAFEEQNRVFYLHAGWSD